MRALNLAASTEYFEGLSCAYAEKHRFYHTDKHISAMLEHLDHVIEQVKKPPEVELAIWFHDAIYKPHSSTNEADSAQWATRLLASQNVSQQTTEYIHKLIMATAHNSDLERHDEKLIVDIDLTILGAPSQDFDEFERNIRNEYRLVPSFIYRKKRKALLETFLSREQIYHTDYFADRYELSARENLQRVIAHL